MPVIYAADTYCDSCAEKIREEILKTASIEDVEMFSDERDYDSGEFPKYMSEDEESDCPQHCGSLEECLEAEELPSGDKIGKLLSHSLTAEGVKYVQEAIAEGGEVAGFWKAEFESAGYEFDNNKTPESEEEDEPA